MKTIEEICSILNTYSSGPIVVVAAKDLLAHYDALAKQVNELLPPAWTQYPEVIATAGRIIERYERMQAQHLPSTKD